MSLAFASPARATYSVVAVDRARGAVGGAGTSCVGNLDVGIILATVPGVGAVHAQALVNEAGRDKAAALLHGELSPADIIAKITAPDFDPDAAQRQYAVVVGGDAAVFTGSTNLDHASARHGSHDGVTYAVLGNILTSEAVLTQAEGGFKASACDLPERLIQALEAGAHNGEGDRRCTGSGIPSDSAFIRVVDASGATLIDLSARDTAPSSPVVALRQQFDDWRAEHPCETAPLVVPEPPPHTEATGCREHEEGPPAWVLMGLVGLLRRRR